MKIFVTGHKGFLGSAFVERYATNYNIVGFYLKDGEELLDYQAVVKKMAGAEQVVHFYC